MRSLTPSVRNRHRLDIVVITALLPIERALNILGFSNKKAATLVRKVLESAVANAEHNDGADIDELRVVEVYVNEGPTMKRMRPRARGRADRISKRTSHVTVKVAVPGAK